MNDPNMTIMGYTFNMYGGMLLVLFLFFAFGLWRAQRAGKLDWTDMITRDGTKVSATKVLQLVGGIVGTWIMVQLTMQGKLTWDMFAIYLGYVASIDGFAKLIMAKYGSGASDDSHAPYGTQYTGYGNNPYGQQQYPQYQAPQNITAPPDTPTTMTPEQQAMFASAKTPE